MSLDTKTDSQMLGIFANLLFSRVALEDVAQVAPDSIERLAKAALNHMSEPFQGVHCSIRLIDVGIERGGHKSELTVIEALNEDMPFLLASTLAAISDAGYEPRLVAHPIIAVERDKSGRLNRIVGEAAGNTHAPARRESFIHIHIDRIDDPQARAALIDILDKTYTDVQLAVQDWQAMRSRIDEAIAAYRNNPPPLPVEEVAEAIRFLEWMISDNFTLLGARDYRFRKVDEAADPVDSTGFGIMRDPTMRVLRRGNELVMTTPEVLDFLKRPVALIITKANIKSRVHRRVHLDYVGVKLFAKDGQLEGELRIVGLFTSNAYTGSPALIPYLRHKVSQVVALAHLDAASYSGRGLLNVLESYPRDELFQVDAETLHRLATSIMQLSERPRIRALARLDAFDRFVSVLVFIPKDRYDTAVRRRVGELLARLYDGHLSAAYPAYPEGPLARTHYIIGRTGGDTPHVSQDNLETEIATIVRTWGDSLKETLDLTRSGATARTIATRYADAFSAAYREAFTATQALDDIATIDAMSAERTRAVRLRRREADPDSRASLKLFARGGAMSLSSRVPLLENLGFRVVNERTYRIMPAGASEEERVWLHDMTLERAAGGNIELDTAAPRLEAALMALLRDISESDPFDALGLEAGLGWRDVAMVRALAHFLRQTRVPYAQAYIAATLLRYPLIAQTLVDLVYVKFDPRLADAEREQRETKAKAAAEMGLSSVSSLEDDRILRRMLNLVDAAVRTNFFQIGQSGLPRETIAFKFASKRLDGLPLPRPLYEIFVYSPRVEGVHLRFGQVARGGLRWSDRPMDFRTEVLGLVKAQQVKNAVIVPVGAKGGFVPRRLPPVSDRAAWMAEGTEAYRIFVRTLLEMTDNIVGDKIVPPENTVRHDGDDPYLVVAADKGTATFSDTANALSLDKGHWLGDAFASGGSQGYDHKKMGITARGAWEAVKRHFREIDIDIQTQAITVAGVGDMSGDVFGNGMLLSPVLKLVAAFDHRDIFIDPDPDAAASFAERQRLFNLPRSSWQDYTKSLISAGGGVFSRAEKSIPLSSQMKALLGLNQDMATPAEIMSAILKAQVDLMWFGGIGTYIRASDETDDQVGDRANDSIRITGSEIRAKVMGEGANLGATQKGRIEAGRKGVRLNTDAIDNSAGVNTSDVEVNIKIALSIPERDGRLAQDARNTFLANMTDEVGALVLRNNYLQSLALSLTQRRGAAEIGFQQRFMRALEADGRLDRAVEYLPDDQALAALERRGDGLTRPEIAVLLAYAKLTLHDALLASNVPDNAYFARELERYFPKAVLKAYPDAVASHRLRREIVATQLANAIINRGGPTIITRLADQTGADAPAIARAYALARDSYDLISLNSAIDALDGKLTGNLQLSLYSAVQDITLNRTAWFLRNTDASGDLEADVDIFRSGINEVTRILSQILPSSAAATLASRTASYVASGLSPDLATRIASLSEMAAAPDIVLVSRLSGKPVKDVAATYFVVDEAFRLGQLNEAGRAVTVTDYYDRLALERALDGIDAAQRHLTAEIVQGGGVGEKGVTDWIATRESEITRIRATVDQIVSSGLSVSKLTVAASLIGDMANKG
jgi:glutamate dehydrogenase